VPTQEHRFFIRVRDGRPDLKPIHEMRLAMAQDRLRQFLEKVRPEKNSKIERPDFCKRQFSNVPNLLRDGHETPR
jgi:truncated hemoglobin YjbI